MIEGKLGIFSYFLLASSQAVALLLLIKVETQII